MKAMELFMLEQALIDYSKLSPSHKDRTDHRNVLLSWSRDLGRGCGLTGILGDDTQSPIRQQADFWLLSGAPITNHRLNSSIQQSHLEESVVSTQNTDFRFTGYNINRYQSSVPTRQNPTRRRCIKAVMLKLYLPEGHVFTANNWSIFALPFTTQLCSVRPLVLGPGFQRLRLPSSRFQKRRISTIPFSAQFNPTRPDSLYSC